MHRRPQQKAGDKDGLKQHARGLPNRPPLPRPRPTRKPHPALRPPKKKNDRRETAPYTFLGPATYVTHQGERPMSITWRLRHPMPAELFEEMKVAAG